jgi:hypothetical protein
MAEAYGKRPCLWFGVTDPDLCDDIDEAAHFVGMNAQRLNEATKQVPAGKPPKNQPPMKTVPQYERQDINWVFGFVPDKQTGIGLDAIGSDDLYGRLMADLDGHTPQA